MQIAVETFASTVLPESPRSPAVASLYAILSAGNPAAPLSGRLDWVESLGDWLLRDSFFSAGPPAIDQRKEPVQTRRLRLLLRACERVPEAEAIVAGVLRSVLAETDAVRLLSEAGLPGHHGFFAEALDRLSKRILPAPRNDTELLEIAPRVFADVRDVLWLRRAPRPLVASFAERLISGGTPGASDWKPLRAGVLDAIELLAIRIAALGLAEDVRARSPSTGVADSPFVRLERLHRAMAARERAGEPRAPEEERARIEALRACRATIRAAVAQLERFGVSVDLVYRLELIQKSLLRLEHLTASIIAPRERVATAAADLLVALLRDVARDRSLRALVQSNLRHLSLKIVDRAGDTGEHYITSSRGEWMGMIGSAAGGGLLTAGTTIAKFQIYFLHLPPFFDGLAGSVNYAGSFVLMQLLGFTLATKQPSMTAAALARELHDAGEDVERDLEPLVDQIARITRSQMAAAFGNLLFVAFAACAVETALRLSGKGTMLSPAHAEGVIASLHPLQSGTVFYAALTGVLLWASSIGAGWFENWAIYQRVPDGLAASRRLRRWLGEKGARSLADRITHHLSGFGGNVTLGVLLGMVPVFGTFFGAPLDVRHVTLSMGSLSFAGFALVRQELPVMAFLWALAGIGVIGVLNFGVSFALALEVAMRARDVGRAGHWSLLKAVTRRLLRNPRQFVIPPRDAPETAHSGQAGTPALATAHGPTNPAPDTPPGP